MSVVDREIIRRFLWWASVGLFECVRTLLEFCQSGNGSGLGSVHKPYSRIGVSIALLVGSPKGNQFVPVFGHFRMLDDDPGVGQGGSRVDQAGVEEGWVRVARRGDGGPLDVGRFGHGMEDVAKQNCNYDQKIWEWVLTVGVGSPGGSWGQSAGGQLPCCE